MCGDLQVTHDYVMHVEIFTLYSLPMQKLPIVYLKLKVDKSASKPGVMQVA